MTTDVRKSLLVFSFFILTLVLVKLFIMLNPDMLRSVTQVSVFAWPFLVLWSVLGAIGVVLAVKSGFAMPWDASISSRLRFYYPWAIGLGLGALAVWVDTQTHWAAWVAQGMSIDSIHIPFPASVPIYFGGAIVVEIIYQIFPIGFFYWLVAKLMMKKDSGIVFWILAILTSLLEPASSINLYQHSVFAAITVVCHDFAMNLSQAWFFRKAGIISALQVRLGYYLLWHIVGPLFLG